MGHPQTDAMQLKNMKTTAQPIQATTATRLPIPRAGIAGAPSQLC